ncbi:MAG: Transcriptional regulator [Candidatus Gottesmanbacteria bacterium GW2011_GWC2_39_8]|uniref:Transcriptional regulator n=1 Tax=Candidatus Gottesmanbacteria bacterium GW2011_GWC2_39_8 TaxID=1618450 RepID=A0A0G0Q0I3_9BACT|nr:MAG: Transcriptional regulator [Candidatus Gottesmanbacteria bacterium GW2011_GWC2_39_8]
MLSDIIVSRVRVKILNLFLSSPGKIYHVREIVRRTDEEINAVRRELLHMEKAGMMTKERRANRLFYCFRKDYFLYFELLELIAKTHGLGGDILKHKAKLGKIKFAMLSGRFIRGLPRETNNVDMLLVGKVVLPELSQLVRAEEGRREAEINYTVMTEDEFEFRKSRRDPFVLGILAGSRIMVLGDEEELVS